MKCAKLVMFFALALLVTTSSAARLVKSKLGDIDVTSEKGGGKVVCTASFNDELTIVRDDDVTDFEGVTIDRDFREYLTYTIDREQTEMHNGEN